jgi:hypothetical protein
MAGKVLFNTYLGFRYCTLTFAKPFTKPPVCGATQGTLFGSAPYVITVETLTTQVSFTLHRIPQQNYNDTGPVEINYTCWDAPVAPSRVLDYIQSSPTELINK